MLPKLERASLTKQVSQQLLAYITETGLKPGETLPTEMELAEHFGVSRAVVREGLSSLSALGVIHSQIGRRPQVAALQGDSLSIFFETALRLDSAAIRDLLELRKVLEQFGASQAAQNVTPAAIAQLESICLTIDNTLAAADYEAFIEADYAFHMQIAAMSGNTILKYLVEALREAMRGSMLYGMKARRSPDALERVRLVHHDILAALKSGDPAAAQAAMTRHFDDAISSILENESKPE